MDFDLNGSNYLCDEELNAICPKCMEINLSTCEGSDRPLYWDQEFSLATPFSFPLGEWFCLDIMGQINTPNQHDGVMAYWVNNELIHKLENMIVAD
jgi:hypothetical protein